MSIKKKAVSGAFWTTIQTFSSQGIGFIVSIILARLLEPEQFGLIGMLGVVMALSNTIINGGLTQSLIRSSNLVEEDYSTVFFFNLIGSLFIYFIVFLSAPFIADFYKQEQLESVIKVYCLTLIINAFSTVQMTRLTKSMDFKIQMKISIPSLIIGSSVGILLAYSGFGVWSLVWSALIQSLVATIQLWYSSKWRPLWVFSRDKFYFHFHFGFKLMFSGILDTLFTNAYTIIIGKFFSSSQVGYYNRANALQMLPVSNLSSIITRVSFPLFAQIKEDNLRLKNIYKKIMQLVIYLVAPTLIFMAVLAEPLFRFLFTEKWLPAVPYFQILCLNGILYPIHSYNLQILTVKGRSDLFLKLEIIKKIITLLALVVSFQFGIFGLLYGSVITSIICFFINTHYSGKFLHYSSWEQMKDLLPIVLLSFLIGLLVFVFDSFLFIELNDLLRLVIGSVIGILLYLISSFIFKMSSFTELKNLISKK